MTLERVPEPEVMDTPAEARDYDAMDHSEVNRHFVNDLLNAARERLGTDDFGGEVLDLGTGTAQIPVALCQHTTNCRVAAIDLSVNMLDLARYNIEIAGFIERIGLAHLDSKNLPFDDGRFIVVMSNSIIHHIPEPATVLREALRVAAPGGLLFFRDLLRPDDDATVRQLVDTYTGNADSHQRKMFDDSLRAALSLAEIRAEIVAQGFPAESVQATSDRHWTWSVRKWDTNRPFIIASYPNTVSRRR